LNKLSAVVIVKNEERNLTRCLESLQFADEIIVVDTGSTDKTPIIARELGAKVYHIEWNGFGPAKKNAVDNATGEWILSIDADEEITPVLASEITKAIGSNQDFTGYYIPRKTNFLGRWINHSRWYPDYVLRLFRKDKGQFTDSLVHEKVILHGETGKFRNYIKHYSYPDTKTFFDKLDRYSTLSAQELLKKGRKFSVFALICKTVASFCRHYITGAGFLDGLEGFIIAVLSAYGVFIRYVKLYYLEKTSHKNESFAS